MKKILIASLAAFASLTAINGNAQMDKHFSMFTESPVFLNPATQDFRMNNCNYLQIIVASGLRLHKTRTEPFQQVWTGEC